jgi:hypothetical protein
LWQILKFFLEAASVLLHEPQDIRKFVLDQLQAVKKERNTKLYPAMQLNK